MSTKRHIKELLNMIHGGVKGTTTSPAKKDMFDINIMSQALNKKSADLFHSVEAKTLWILSEGDPIWKLHNYFYA